MTSQELTAQAATLLLQYLAFVERQGSDAGFRALAPNRVAQFRREALKLHLIEDIAEHLTLTASGRRAIEAISMAAMPLPTVTPQDLSSRRA
jgi:hypothetical protein